MTAELTYTLEGRPTSWKRTEGKGRVRFTGPAMRAAKAAHAYAALAARQAWAVKHRRPWPLAGAFVVDVQAYMPHRGSLPDWDNLGKLVSDAVQGVLFTDDVQVEDGRVRRFIDRDRPRCEVRVRLMEAA